MRAFLVLVVAMGSSFLPITGNGVQTQVVAHATPAPAVIRTRDGLDRYLHASTMDTSPLSLLPAGARKRFLGTLAWGENKLGGFDPAILPAYLTDAQIFQVLALFDAQDYASMMHGRATPLSEAARRASETPLEQQYNQWYFARADAAHGSKPAIEMDDLYDRLLAPYQTSSALAQLGDSDVLLLFRAARATPVDPTGEVHGDDLRLDLGELHRRGLATPSQVSQVHDQLVAARRFEDANALAKQYPIAAIAPLPPLQQASDAHAGDPTALTLRPDGTAMLRKAIDMQAALRIVVVAGCHFSEDAARAIQADPQLGPLFREHAIWLAAESESLPDVLKWNREFPDQAMHVAWRTSEWPMLDSWDIPTFYVFRNGTRVAQWSGWPADSGMQTLRTHLGKAGLLD